MNLAATASSCLLLSSSLTASCPPAKTPVLSKSSLVAVIIDADDEDEEDDTPSVMSFAVGAAAETECTKPMKRLQIDERASRGRVCLDTDNNTTTQQQCNTTKLARFRDRQTDRQTDRQKKEDSPPPSVSPSLSLSLSRPLSVCLFFSLSFPSIFSRRLYLPKKMTQGEKPETEGDGRQEGDVACRLYDVTV